MSEKENRGSADRLLSKRFLNIRWMRAVYIWLALSLFLFFGSIAVVAVKGLNFGIDFVGGTVLEISMPQDKTVDQVRTILQEKSGLIGVQVQRFGTEDMLVRVQHQEGGEAAQQRAVTTIKNTLASHYGVENVTYRRVEVVGPKVSGELMQTGVIALISALAAMLLYIWFRFDLPFAIGSVIALFHDVLITLGIFAIFRFDFDLSIVAALLTIIGYSMNDTVVIYDRIRENLLRYRKASVSDIIDLSVNETMARTIVTAGTLALSLIALLVYGGDVIRPFIIAMTCGVVIGTYSSIFIASPFLIWLGVRRAVQTEAKEVQKKELVVP